MKKVLFPVLLVLPFLLGACSDWSEAQYTPAIYPSSFIWHPLGGTQPADTLYVVGYPNQMDTIAVGDTVSFHIIINAITNTLTDFSFSRLDTTALDFSLTINGDIKQALSDSSSVEDCRLVFKNGYVAMGFGVQYVARKVGVHEVTMKVSSTSKFSPAFLTFTQPVF